MAELVPEFSRPFDPEGLGQAGRVVQLQARPEECEALAKRFGLLALKGLNAELELQKRGGRIVELTGQFQARVEQRCVVSLERFESLVEGAIERRYLLGGPGLDQKELLDPEAEDPPEVLNEAQLDLGEAVAEEVALSLDPHPRRPEARLEKSSFGPQGDEDQEDERKKPFAALARLKKDTDS